jgi:acyl CoA:acetate/3-ketoacid CoA transferase beta subunit
MMQVLEAGNVANTMTAKKMIAAVAVEEEKAKIKKSLIVLKDTNVLRIF